MKTANLLVLVVAMSFAQAYAQTADEQVLNSAPINVDGYLAEERPVTDGELEQIRSELNKQKMGTQLNKVKAKDLGKLTNQTEKLLDSQDEYIDSKIESSQAIKEFNQKYEENQKKLNCIMEESTAEDCAPYKSKYASNKRGKQEVEQQINVQQAAPVVSRAEVAPAANTGAPFEEIKLLINAGATNYKGDLEDLQSELAGNLRVESNINSRFSMGVGFNYSQLKTNDFGGDLYGYGGGYGAGYYGYGGYGAQGREIQYKSMGIDLYGKFFITKGERFRPYVGAGLGFNQANIQYSQNNPWGYNDPYNGYQNFGGEKYKTTFATGTLMAGSEVLITQGFGFNIMAQYSTGLGNSLSSKNSQNPFNSPDQKRLQTLGKDIINANAISIFLGAVIKF